VKNSQRVGEGRPATGRPFAGEVAAQLLFDVTSTDTEPEKPGIQLRRRHAASLRCQPLADGRRDPWLANRERWGSRTLHVIVHRNTAWLHGERVFELLDQVGVERRQWDYRERVWMIPIQHADDVMAYAEWKQRRVVTCEAADR
jgi:hypothetical protein